MGEKASGKILDEEVEAALLDADLFVKYKAAGRAVERLQGAIARHPRSVALREKLREVALVNKQPDEAAHDRLLQAKQIDPRISIATGLEAIRRARRPDLQQPAQPAPAPARAPAHTHTLAGDLSAVSIFDVVQVIENARLTGALRVESAARTGSVLFNAGSIVGAHVGAGAGEAADALAAFRSLLEITSGIFDFEKTAHEFPVEIQASSNTSLILDSLREIDEGKQ